MNTEKYSGWTNRETWLVNLYYSPIFDMNVDEYLYNQETTEHRQVSLVELADYLKDLFDCLMEEELRELPTFITDYLDFGIIDWIDIAEQYIVEPLEEDNE